MATALPAEVVRFEETQRTLLADGATFGDVGAYERVDGRLHLVIDPNHPANRRIVDLALAPRDTAGQVRFSTAVTLLRPADPARRTGTVLLEVPNRGSKSVLAFFQRGNERTNAPRDARHLGDGFLLRQGFTLAWVGWQQDLPFDPDLLGMDRVELTVSPPPRGLARAELVPVDPVRTIPLGHRGHQAYPAVEPNDPRHVLMVTAPGSGQRRVVPRPTWHFARLDREGRLVADPRWVVVDQPLAPGSVIEVVYQATDPVVVGLGLLAIRDAAAFFKRNGHLAGDAPVGSPDAAASNAGNSSAGNPVTDDPSAGSPNGDRLDDAPTSEVVEGVDSGGESLGGADSEAEPAGGDAAETEATTRPPATRRVLAFGNSQGGRLLRHLLYLGLDRDASGLQVFDGLWIHAAGAGRGSFNHRFAQPSRDGQPLSSLDYPTDLFPFAPAPQRDGPWQDSLVARSTKAGGAPRLILTSSGYDYWGRGMSLVHTELTRGRDLDLGASVRLYHFASSQHFVDRFPPAAVGTRFPGNPVDYRLAARALLVAVERWLAGGVAPPPSRYPRRADGTLVPASALRFPGITGIAAPSSPRPIHRLDFGPHFVAAGIVDWQPPLRGEPYPVLVPQVDALGNERAGVRMPEVEVPVATTTGWNFRTEKIGAPEALADFRGSFLPLSRTLDDRRRHGDSRPSLAELYTDEATYRQRFLAAAERLVEEGFLLREDLPELETRATEWWKLVAEGALRLPKPEGSSGR